MNVAGATAGSVLLLMGDRYAAWMFAVSVIGLGIVSYLFYSAPIPRVAGDPWAAWAATVSTASAAISATHSLAVIVAVRSFMPKQPIY
ncbi:MAG: hypothetical protein AAFR88_12490 [Pseudomonadota bacterium]